MNMYRYQGNIINSRNKFKRGLRTCDLIASISRSNISDIELQLMEKRVVDWDRS